jgi:hypothetical protein
MIVFTATDISAGARRSVNEKAHGGCVEDVKPVADLGGSRTGVALRATGR